MNRIVALSRLLGTLALCSAPGCGALDEEPAIVSHEARPLYVASTKLWRTRAIPVCWDSAGSATEKEWVRTAVQRTWEKESGVSFFGWGTCTTGSLSGVRITISDEGPHTLGLGTELNGVPRGMVLNFSYLNWSTSCQTQRESCTRAIAVHEFGHALGFAHEQNRPDTPTSCTQPPQGSNGDTTVGAWDPNSVMNYCNAVWNNGGQLSQTDKIGARRFYGAPAEELVAGDIDGDRRADLALTGGLGWSTVPVAFSNGNGTFRVTNLGAQPFATYAAQPGARPVAGDFDGDGRTDLALTGGVGWNTVPVAFSNGDGTFRITNFNVSGFPLYATQADARPVAGDFNGDGKTDLALTGGVGWSTVPVAFSNGDGTFRVTNMAVSNFPLFSSQQGARSVAGDFNGDGKADLALTGGVGWNTVPVAFSNGDGTFRVTNYNLSGFPLYATQAGARPVVGDFNGDRKADLALTGGVGWSTVPVAFSNGDGTFRVTNAAVGGFPGYATQVGARAVAADLNGDGRADIALSGGLGWSSVPVAFSVGDGNFLVSNSAVADFPTYAAQ